MTRIKLVGAMVVSLGILAGPVLAGSMADQAVRMVQGKVVAMNTIDAPQVIVVSVLIKNTEELIVGATVGTEAESTKKGRPIRLHDIAAGEKVAIT